MNRYFIEFAYNGTAYCGWQIQPNGVSVQEILEKALTTIMRNRTAVTGAGRTDSGVHALNMTAHFDTELPLPDPQKLIINLNSLLPQDIAVHSIREVQPNAHARFDALSRRYEYHIIFDKNPFLTDQACRLHSPLDIDAMNRAAQTLFDYTDFTSFSKLHTDVKTNDCTIIDAHWQQLSDRLIFHIEANRFLRNMVRAIVGTLLQVGTNKITIEKFRQIIESKNRCNAGHSVPACGLYFVRATYPESIYTTPQQ